MSFITSSRKLDFPTKEYWTTLHMPNLARHVNHLFENQGRWIMKWIYFMCCLILLAQLLCDRAAAGYGRDQKYGDMAIRGGWRGLHGDPAEDQRFEKFEGHNQGVFLLLTSSGPDTQYKNPRLLRPSNQAHWTVLTRWPISLFKKQNRLPVPDCCQRFERN
ncbi:hypothetical protein PtA15_10A141 [Puccinia triticina]|uniref:Uncharacterized protein n=1 Tax=Puccinia triticina TaxID=208348 RepID=A0ABY7D181_9BASI|nr:uncharacterized protein PtA15_10A141 [Puccinia triticina]WAQ88722.1 hypothetical protein PtA15_10A141 [Puccinia triticina]